MNRKSFIYYVDYDKQLDFLTNEELGRLIRVMSNYVRTGKEPPLDGNLKIAWLFIKEDLNKEKTKLHNADDNLIAEEKDFEIIWTEYPRKKGKTMAFKYYRKYVNQGKKINGKNVKLSNDQMYEAVLKYANEVKNKEEQYIQLGSTFFNTTILDYVEDSKNEV